MKPICTAVACFCGKHFQKAKLTCSLCKQPEVETLEFEGGNNAELSMQMHVCEIHLAEYDKDENKFQDKYAEKIDDGCYERLIGHADMLRDD